VEEKGVDEIETNWPQEVADEVQQYIWARTDEVQQLSPEVYRRKVILLGHY
jgi:hypothetical protein